MKKTFVFSLIVLSILSISISVSAIQRFTVKGQVFDAQTCEPLADVKLILHHIENGITDELFTKEDGDFIKHFTLIGNVTVHAEKAGYTPFDGRVYARLGDNEMVIALLKENKPVTAVCEKIENSPLGKYLKSLITEIPEIPEEKGLSEKYESAKASITIQDYDTAIKLLLEEEKTVPNNFAISFYLGLCYYESQKYDDAIARWTKSYEISPSKIIILRNLCKAWEKKNNRVKAAEYMQKYSEEFAKLDTAKPEEKKQAFFDSGIYWYNASVPEKSFEAFKKVVEFDPANGDAWYYIGMYYFANQKNKECVEAMEKAIASLTISEDNKQTAIAIRDAAKSAM